MIIKKIYHKFLTHLRLLYLKKQRKKLKTKNLSLICNNCLGGFIYNKYGMKFNSPTINTWFDNDLDFFIFVDHLKDYLDGKLIDVKNEPDNAGHIYPQGYLKSKNNGLKKLHISFVHYNSPEEAITKWNERKERIIWDKIVILADLSYPPYPRDNLEQCIEHFKNIKFKKMLFLRNDYFGYSDNTFIFKLPGNARAASHQKMTKTKMYFDQFDFANFINEGFKNE